jgi:hypothetical protein
MALDQPVPIVQRAKLLQCLPELLPGGKVNPPGASSFERPDEPRDEAVGLCDRMHLIGTMGLDASE